MFFDQFLYRIPFFYRINFLTWRDTAIAVFSLTKPSHKTITKYSRASATPLTPQLRPALSHDVPAATFHNSIAGARGVWQRHLLVCHRNLDNHKRQQCLRSEGNTSETHFPQRHSECFVHVKPLHSLAPLTTLSRVLRLARAFMPRRLREPPASPTPPAPSSGAPPMGKTGPR